MPGPSPTLALWRGLSIACLTYVGAGEAAAETRYNLSGFGTLGYAVLDHEDAEFRTASAVDGADDRGSFEVDSRLGLQLDIEPNPRWSATLQGLAREGIDGEPDAQLEWAFLRWLPSDSVTVRVGRMALPVYSLSDYREVGYANTMLRPPEDVYAQVPLRSFDGADANVYVELGETLWSAQLLFGQSDLEQSGGLDIEARDMLGVNVTAERGPFRLRVSHARTRLSATSDDLTALEQATRQAAAFVPALEGLAVEFSDEPGRMTFSGAGLSVDLDPIVLDAEYTRRESETWAPDIDSWYVSASLRAGAFTPYAFASASEGTESRRRGIDLPDVPALAPLEDGLRRIFDSQDQSTIGLGLRWDVAPNVALKGQLERISGENGQLSTRLASGDDVRDDDDDVLLSSIALDFVF